MASLSKPEGLSVHNLNFPSDYNGKEDPILTFADNLMLGNLFEPAPGQKISPTWFIERNGWTRLKLRLVPTFGHLKKVCRLFQGSIFKEQVDAPTLKCKVFSTSNASQDLQMVVRKKPFILWRNLSKNSESRSKDRDLNSLF